MITTDHNDYLDCFSTDIGDAKCGSAFSPDFTGTQTFTLPKGKGQDAYVGLMFK